MADENQPPKKSYQRFDEETIKNALIRDGTHTRTRTHAHTHVFKPVF